MTYTSTVDEQLAALAIPQRREILRLVRHDELAAGRIASHFTVSRPAVSQHLRVLRDAGLVSERREGRRRLYRLRPEAFAEVAAFVAEFWDIHLERLRNEAERQELELRAREARDAQGSVEGGVE